MRHCLASFALLVGVAIPAGAQNPEPPIQLTIHPAVAPSPALRYQLLPQVEDLAPGNRAQLYFRSFSPEWDGWRRREGFLDQVDRALQMPLKDLPRKDLDWILDSQQFHEVDLAARREYLDWDYTRRLRQDGVSMLLPDVQSFRITANVLALRARLEIADHHYDKALATLQTGYALGRDVGDAPLLVSALVGVAISMGMTNQVEAFIQAPGSPNLYWALTSLPRPMVSLIKPLQGEKMLIYTELPELRQVDTRLSAQQRQKLQEEVLHLIALAQDRPPPKGENWEGKLELTALVSKQYADAKRALIGHGRKAEDVERMSALQVVMIQGLEQSEQLRDDLFKWFQLPYWQALPQLTKIEQRLAAAKQEVGPLHALVPNPLKVYTTATRLDRRIAALRCIEAIRLHAAAHDGKLPATLNDIRAVPIPLDPMTGNAFQYKLDGNKASLSAPAPPGLQFSPDNTLTYELILER